MINNIIHQQVINNNSRRERGSALGRIIDDKERLLKYYIVLPYNDFKDRMRKTEKLKTEMKRKHKGYKYNINVLDGCLMCEFEHPESQVIN